MFDINDILKSETVKNLILKTGISEKQVNDVIKQAINVLTNKFKEQPIQMSSLLSSNPNTKDDDNLLNKMGSELSSKLTNKLGVSTDKAKSIQSTMPQIVTTISKKFNDKGLAHQQGFESFFKTAETFLGKKENQSMLINTTKSIFSTFFDKK